MIITNKIHNATEHDTIHPQATRPAGHRGRRRSERSESESVCGNAGGKRDATHMNARSSTHDVTIIFFGFILVVFFCPLLWLALSNNETQTVEAQQEGKRRHWNPLAYDYTCTVLEHHGGRGIAVLSVMVRAPDMCGHN
jgi:hypothetical protein